MSNDINNIKYLYVEKLMPKDRWGIPVPAEWSKSIGLEKGQPVIMGLDTTNNRIIIISSKDTSDLNLINFGHDNSLFNKNEIIDLLKQTIDSDEDIKQEIISTYSNYKDEEPESISENETCYYCGSKIKPDKKYLKVNGHKLCNKCKKTEIQRFLLYLERRQSDAKE